MSSVGQGFKQCHKVTWLWTWIRMGRCASPYDSLQINRADSISNTGIRQKGKCTVGTRWAKVSSWSHALIHCPLIHSISALTQNTMGSELLVIILGYEVFYFPTVLEACPREEDKLLGTPSPYFLVSTILCFYQSNSAFICFMCHVYTFYCAVRLNGFLRGTWGRFQKYWLRQKWIPPVPWLEEVQDSEYLPLMD